MKAWSGLRLEDVPILIPIIVPTQFLLEHHFVRSFNHIPTVNLTDSGWKNLTSGSEVSS